MGRDSEKSVVLARGKACTIECAVRANGSMPAREFIEELEAAEQRKLAVLFQRLADTGRISNREQFRKVTGKIWEFKRYQVRVGCFQAGTRWLLTHGFHKKADHWPKGELERAERIRVEHLNQEQTRKL